MSSVLINNHLNKLITTKSPKKHNEQMLYKKNYQTSKPCMLIAITLHDAQLITWHKPSDRKLK